MGQWDDGKKEIIWNGGGESGSIRKMSIQKKLAKIQKKFII